MVSNYNDIFEKTLNALSARGVYGTAYVGEIIGRMEYDGNWEPEDYVDALIKEYAEKGMCIVSPQHWADLSVNNYNDANPDQIELAFIMPYQARMWEDN